VQTYRAATSNPVLFPAASEPHHHGTLPAARSTGTASLSLLERVLELLALGRVPDEVQLEAFRGLTGIAIGFIAGQVDGLLPAAGATAPEHKRSTRSRPVPWPIPPPSRFRPAPAT
jgi:hypothetical protein